MSPRERAVGRILKKSVPMSPREQVVGHRQEKMMPMSPRKCAEGHISKDDAYVPRRRIAGT